MVSRAASSLTVYATGMEGVGHGACWVYTGVKAERGASKDAG